MTNSGVISKTWGEFTPDDVFEMAVLRSEVFFLEQRIEEEEFDHLDRDPETRHLWLSDDRGMSAYLRIVGNREDAALHGGAQLGLGRMVVRKDARGQGLAQVLMDAAIAMVGDQPLFLHAQEYVMSLYAKSGFTAVGETFLEAGIPHRVMVRPAGG